MSNTQVATQQNNMSLGELMHSPAVVGKLNEVWNSPQMANSFMSSVISVANGNPQLRNAEPMSIIGAAMDTGDSDSASSDTAVSSYDNYVSKNDYLKSVYGYLNNLYARWHKPEKALEYKKNG